MESRVQKAVGRASHRRTQGEETDLANRLEGKVAAVTGGDQGIGRAIVERLAAEGADVALCYRSNKLRADEGVAAVPKGGRQDAGVQCDVAQRNVGPRVLDESVRQFGL